jgi:N-methylhydantoinase A
MFGALRMISVQQGYDPRDFALMGFGGAGPLHINSIARLMGSYPAVSPVSPGVLCALGDATTRSRTETARSLSKRLSEIGEDAVLKLMAEMERQVRMELEADGLSGSSIQTEFEIDLRYSGQAFEIPMPVQLETLQETGLQGLATSFDAEHRRLFTFNMEAEHELVNLRAVARGQMLDLPALELPRGDGNPGAAKLRDHDLWMDGAPHAAAIYDRSRLRAGDIIQGPAIVTEMDSTTLVELGHIATVDRFGNIMITPV